eukprot:TRINITY_DN1855_c0_g1_i1.p1 TRINITY_DN1855_c0_g1~~TRINITY_DN1855_c0_g1_i1.p1  ORF type:complete len:851 (+),score=306.79 TRINITY_DN1855_c0_g1_i1:147-2699(+)
MAIPTCIAGLDAKILLMSNEASKVVAHDMHPFKPWVVTGHENGNVTLWDYNTQNILISFFVNEIDEGTREQLNILRAAERSPDYKGSKDAEAQLKALEKAKVGAIRSVRFMDKDTQKAAFLLRQRIRRRKQREGGSAPPPAATSASSSQLKEGGSPTVPERRQRRPTLMAADSRKFRKERKQETNLFECQWMLVLTEYRMFMYDYVTQEVKELPSSGLDLKPQLACSPLGIGSMVAITGSDGVMRVFDMEHRKMVSKFPCGKQAEFVFGFDDTNGQKVVVVTSHGGVIQWWVDLETFLGDGTDKPTQQVVHGGEISAMAVNYSECLVITASSDKSVALFDLASARELMRMKPKTKQVYFGLSSLVHPRFPPRAMLVTLKDDSKLMMLHPEEEKNITKDLLDTNEFPNSQKKNKIHGVSVHPIHSNRIACISRMGLCVVSIEQNSIPSVSAVPSSPTFFAGLQNCVEQLTRESGERVHSHPLTGWGAVNVRVNPLGNYLAVWNGAIYQIVDVSKKSAWKVMDEGPALDVVWAGPSMPLRYAFLAPPIAAGDDAKKKKKGRIGQRSSNKSGGTPQHSKALPTVVIKEFDSNNYPRPVTEDASVKFYVNTLFGGPLLGVSMTPDESQMTGRMASRLNSAISCPSPRPTPSPAGGTLRAASARVRHGTVSAAFNKPPPAITTLTPCDTDYLNQCFSFMAWDGTTAVAEDLPVPLNVVWDTNNNYCAMVFETYFCVFEMRPSWRLVVRQEEAMVSGVWHASSVLFYSTDQHLKCIFPGNASAPPVLVASVDPVEAELLSLSHGTKQLIRHLLPSTQYAVLPVAGKVLCRSPCLVVLCCASAPTCKISAHFCAACR